MVSFDDVGVRAVVQDFLKFNKQMTTISGRINTFGGDAGKASKGAKALSLGMKAISATAVAAAAAVAAVAAATIGIGIAGVKAAISFESAFAGVGKTVDGVIKKGGELTDFGEELKQQYRDLAKEVPVAVEELLGIGELAGQLGIPKEALVDFTETVAELAVTTNLTQEEAATNIARLANIYQIAAEDMASNTEAIGDIIVELGNNFATTERDILAFAERIAGAGKIAGFSQADILAIGAAMSSVGIEAEAGGTAVQKVMLAMTQAVAGGGKDLKKFTDVMGEDFAELFKEDPSVAFTQFVQKLGTSGDEAIGILEGLGLSDQRLIRSFLSLAGASDVLVDAFETSTDASGALSEEAEKRFATTESQIQLFKNNIKDLGITIGDALLPAVNNLLTSLKPFIDNLSKNLPGAIDTAKKKLGEVRETVDKVLGAIRDWVMQENVQQAIKNIGAFFQGSFTVVKTIWDTILKPTLTSLLDVLKSVLDFVVNVFAGDWEAAWVSLQEILVNAWETIKTFLIGVWEGLKLAFIAIWTALGPALANIWEGIKTKASEIWDAIKAAISEKWEEIKTTVSTKLQEVQDKIVAVRDEFVSAGTSLIAGIWDGIKARFETLKQDIKELAAEFVSLVKDLFGIASSSKVFAEIGQNIMGGLQGGIASGFGGVAGTMAAASAQTVSAGLVGAAAPISAGESVTHNDNSITVNATTKPEEPTTIAQELSLLMAQQGAGAG